MVIGVADPGGSRVVAYGRLADRDSRAPDGNTIFEIGSVSKVFTSLLLADMVIHEEVAFDDPVASYLPASVSLPERNGKSITLLDLATHSSGLPRLPSNLQPTDRRNPYAGYRVDDMYEFLSGYALPREPGSAFEYSNLGAGLLGHVLARRAGADYETLIRSRITRPLGMPDTSITLSSSMKHRMATGHDARLAPVLNWDFPALAGAGALRSSANDMVTFVEALLGYRESPVAPAMKTMLEVRRCIGRVKLSLAWFVLNDCIWHNGGTGGFRSFVGCNLKKRTGVIVLSNGATPHGVDDIGGYLLNPTIPLAHLEPPKERERDSPSDF